MKDLPRRIAYLDGLRGLAIMLVVLFHTYGEQFSSLVPYGTQLSWLYPIKYGWLGVELFFLISGFVILMTLENSTGIIDFARRRWLRLFPAMLLASIIIFTFDRLTDSGPAHDRLWADFIPGLLFISPSTLHAFLKIDLQSMDGPYWSLYVEVLFYVIFSLAFFSCGWRFAVATITALYFASLALPSGQVSSAADWLGFVHFGWFASGALYYKWHQTRDGRLLLLAAALSLTSALFVNSVNLTFETRLAAVLVGGIFATSVAAKAAQSILSIRIFTFLGFVSYPLYLMHSNITLGLTSLLGRAINFGGANVLLPIIPLSILTIASWSIARFYEPRFRLALSGARRFMRPSPATSDRCRLTPDPDRA